MRLFQILRNARFGSVLFRYMLSHCVVFILPMTVLSFFLYQHTVVNLRIEVMRSRTQLSERLAQEMDDKLMELSNVAALLSGDEALMPANVVIGTTKSMEAVERLQDFSALISIAEYISVYFDEQDRMYSMDGTISRQTLVKNVYSLTEESKADLFSALQSEKVCEYRRLLQNPNSIASSGNLVGVFYRIPVGSASPYGTILFVLRESVLLKLLSGDGSGERVWVYDAEGRLLVSSGEMPEGILGQGPGTQIFDDEYARTCVVSEKTGWQYVTLVSTDSLLGQVAASQRRLWGMILLCVVVGILSAVMMGIYNYRPVYRLAQESRPESDGFPSREAVERNEFKRIRSGIQWYGERAGTLQEKNTQLEMTLTRQEPIVGQHLLLRLLRGRLSNPTEWQQAFDYLRMREDGTFFVMMLFVSGEAFPESTPEKMDGPVLYASLDFEDGRAVGIEDGSEDGNGKRIAVLAEIYDVGEAGESRDAAMQLQMKQLVHRIRTFMALRYDDTPFCGVGRAAHPAVCIRDSYIEAVTALDFALFHNQDNVQYFENLSACGEAPAKPQLEKGGNLLRLYLRREDRASASDWFSQYIEELCDERQPVAYIHYRMYELAEELIGLARENQVPAAQEQIAGLMQIPSKSEFQKAAQAFWNFLLENQKAPKNDRALLKRIEAYMEAHYQESDFSIAGLAEALHVSQSYLSRYYKEMTGDTMVHALAELRMAEIKRQLVETDRSIRTIVESVGYVDAANFSRKFKSIEGITLNDYRRLYTNREESL